MIVIAEFICYNLSIIEITSTIENNQREHINKNGFIDEYKVSMICHTEYDLKNKTKIII